MSTEVKLQTSFDIYNEKAVEKIKSGTDLLPDYGVDSDSDLEYNKSQINSTIEAAIQSGESIDDISDDLSERLEDISETSAVRTARTAAVSALNSGTLESFYDAQNLGIRIQKKWVCTLDSKTRPSHQEQDGEVEELDDTFDNGLQYPGDPHGDPSEVYNCRCTMTAFLPDYDINDDNPARISKDEVGVAYVTNPSYLSWLNNKQYTSSTSKSESNYTWSLGSITSSLKSYTKPIAEDSQTRLMEKYGVKYVEVEHQAVTEDEDESIYKIAGGDKTLGSCASAAYCYVLRRAGWDVLDYRGDVDDPSYYSLYAMGQERKAIGSRRIMAQTSTGMTFAQLDGVESIITGYGNELVNGRTTWKSLKEDVEYVMGTSCHTAIVIKTSETKEMEDTWTGETHTYRKYGYLELQSGQGDNGWHYFWDYNGAKINTVLQQRFGYHTGLENITYASTVDSLGKNQEFVSDYGYANTRESDQLKGSTGHER